VKNRTLFTIYKSLALLYNTFAVDGTNSTASRTTAFFGTEHQAYDVNTVERVYGCAFAFLKKFFKTP
jgi:hypothetical protein